MIGIIRQFIVNIGDFLTYRFRYTKEDLNLWELFFLNFMLGANIAVCILFEYIWVLGGFSALVILKIIVAKMEPFMEQS